MYKVMLLKVILIVQVLGKKERKGKKGKGKKEGKGREGKELT